MNSIHLGFKVGGCYSKRDIAKILDNPNIETVREGSYHLNENVTLLFSDFEKKGEFQYNNFFQGEYFHWDSSTRQHIGTPRIQEVVKGIRVPYLFARVMAKNEKGQTLPYVYCGRLRFLDYDINTQNPVHIVYQSIDYYEDPSNSELIIIYNWRPTRTDVKESILERYERYISDTRKSKYTKPNKTERRGLITSRVGQGYYREGLLNKWKGKCPVTGVKIAEILIASHILRWSECDDEARLDVDNGILLAPNVDALFDKHLISFTDEGELVYSTELNVEELKRLGIDFNVRIDVTEGMKKYLRLHRLSLR